MSLSNIIKRGEDLQYSIRSFDPEVLTLSEDEPPSAPTGVKGSLMLPGGPPMEHREANNSIEEEEEEEEEESPQEKAARLEREAYEKGFEQGRNDGMELEKKQLDEQRRQLEDLFSGIRGLKSHLFREAEHEVITLSTLIAKRILREEIRTDPSVIQRTIRAALDYVADRTRITIAVNPEDMEEIREILPSLASITEGGQFQIIEDDTLDRGGCTLGTGFGRINASIKEQSASIESVIERTFTEGGGEGL